jgi:hypothetical protein
MLAISKHFRIQEQSMLRSQAEFVSKWMAPAILLCVPIMAEAEPVTYVFSGVIVVPDAPSCTLDNSVNGTITLDFENENPAQSTGSVGSPTGWTSVSTAKTEVSFAPYVFTMTACGFGPFVSVNSSSITVGPGGISGQFEVSYQGASGHISFSNPSGHVSANGMPLFDLPGTGSGLLGAFTTGIPFVVTSMTLVSPSVTRQLDSLVTAAAGAPSLIAIANGAQADVQSACISLESFVLRVKAKEAAKQLTQQRSDQLIFDARTVGIETGCY